MSAASILQVANGLAAGGIITLVGLNGNVVSVTDAGYLESIDTTVRDTVNHATYGNEQIFNALGASGAVGVDLDTLLTRLSSARAGYLDELDFDLSARLGTPAGASLAADLAENQVDMNSLLANLVTVDTVVDGIQTDLDNASDGLGKIATELSGAATSSSYSHLANTNEQDAIEFTQTNIYSILSLHIDLSTFTSGRVITARVYSKIDGTTYRLVDTVLYTVGTHDAITISPQMNLNHHWKITLQINTVEAGAKTINFRYVLADFT